MQIRFDDHFFALSEIGVALQYVLSVLYRIQAILDLVLIFTPCGFIERKPVEGTETALFIDLRCAADMLH